MRNLIKLLDRFEREATIPRTESFKVEFDERGEWHPSQRYQYTPAKDFKCSSCGNVVKAFPRENHPYNLVLKCACGASRTQLIKDFGEMHSFFYLPWIEKKTGKVRHYGERWTFYPEVKLGNGTTKSLPSRRPINSDLQLQMLVVRECVKGIVYFAEGEKTASAVADFAENASVISYQLSGVNSHIIPDFVRGRKCIVLPDRPKSKEGNEYEKANDLCRRLIRDFGCKVFRTKFTDNERRIGDAADMTLQEFKIHLKSRFLIKDRGPRKPKIFIPKPDAKPVGDYMNYARKYLDGKASEKSNRNDVFSSALYHLTKVDGFHENKTLLHSLFLEKCISAGLSEGEAHNIWNYKIRGL